MAGKLAQKCQLEMVLAMKCHHVCGLTFNFCVHLNNYADNRLTLKEYLELITSLSTMQNSQTEFLNIYDLNSALLYSNKAKVKTK